MKRLYDSSRGRLELDLESADVSIWLFDADGRVAAESGDEWDWADISDLLQSEIRLPETEAQSIATNFIEAAKSEGWSDQAEASPIGKAGGLLLVGSVLALLSIGFWTVATWIF